MKIVCFLAGCLLLFDDYTHIFRVFRFLFFLDCEVKSKDTENVSIIIEKKQAASKEANNLHLIVAKIPRQRSGITCLCRRSAWLSLLSVSLLSLELSESLLLEADESWGTSKCRGEDQGKRDRCDSKNYSIEQK
jgi:hypothetical protein